MSDSRKINNQAQGEVQRGTYLGGAVEETRKDDVPGLVENLGRC